MDRMWFTARTVSLVGLLGLAAVSLSACGSDDQSPKEKFLAAYADTYCKGLAPCCAANGNAHDVSACKQFIAIFGSLAGGTFDQKKGDQCLAELKTWTCESPAPDVCDGVFAGSSPPGGSCDSSADCAKPVEGDVTCEYSTDSVGVCKTEPPPAAGQPCSSSASTPTEHYRCTDDPTLFCNYTTEKCEARAALGQPCENGGCVAGADCRSDSTTGQNKCVPLVAVGGDCSTIGCVEEAYCDASSQCIAKKKNGEPCQSFQECLGFCDSDTSLCSGSGGATLCITSD